MAQGTRPLSPHLQIYRWYLTMALSIGHRISGIGIAIGLVLFTWWLTALARGPESFAVVQGAMDNIFGGLILFGFSAALFYHLCSGVRHLVFDAGRSLDKEGLRKSGIIMAASAGFLTVVFWLLLLAAG
jgi:succinate dehydrogenase / fumarate reductase cytochrome b subunit